MRKFILTLKTNIAKLFIILFFLLNSTQSFSQEENIIEPVKGSAVSSLISIKKNIKWLKLEIYKKQENLKKETIEKLKTTLEKEIDDLSERYYNSLLNFADTAAGVNLEVTKKEINPEKRDLLKEVQEVLTPIIEALRRASARPRKIEKFRYEILRLDEKIELTEKALENINLLLNTKDNQEIIKELTEVKNNVTNMIYEYKINIESARRRLNHELGSNKPFIKAGMDSAEDFFRNRGKNLFFSLITFIFIWWIFSLFKKKIFKIKALNETFLWLKKPMKALYNSITFTLASAGAIICLYFMHDWMLVTIILLGLSTVVWTSRQWLPKFIDEARIILNLGTVKEGERLIWENIPWQVKELGFHSTLVNERLQGGRLKVPVKKLINLQSRHVVKKEPWFPTKKGDWVILGDGTFGTILIQTPEQVVLQLKGGSNKYYSTPDFLCQTPTNLSEGYRVEIVFGLDYNIQESICKEIPEIFADGLKKKFAKRLDGEEPDFKDLIVEFHSAGASSLNLWAKVDCPGRLAAIRNDLFREIQNALVDICNKQGFSIPFDQMTVHIPKTTSC